MEGKAGNTEGAGGCEERAPMASQRARALSLLASILDRAQPELHHHHGQGRSQYLAVSPATGEVEASVHVILLGMICQDAWQWSHKVTALPSTRVHALLLPAITANQISVRPYILDTGVGMRKTRGPRKAGGSGGTSPDLKAGSHHPTYAHTYALWRVPVLDKLARRGLLASRFAPSRHNRGGCDVTLRIF